MSFSILDLPVLNMLETRLSSGDEGAGLFLAMWVYDSEVHEPSYEARLLGWRVG